MDLNDLRYYAAIVDAGSLSGASRNLGVTKSLLSQHLVRLEQSLGVCLIQRTTRKLQVTPIGQEFHHRCLAVLAEVGRAQSLVDEAIGTPRGPLKISCPVLFAQVILAPVVTSFLREYPEVELRLDADYRDVDLIGEGYDLALKIQRQLEDSRLVVRSFALDRHWVVSAPSLAEQLGHPRTPAALSDPPSVAACSQGDSWQLFDARERPAQVRHRPRLLSNDALILKQAAVAGTGIALLPSAICTRELADGHLVRLLPRHHGGTMHLHAMYPSRHGLQRAARCFLEHLASHLPGQMQDAMLRGTDPHATAPS